MSFCILKTLLKTRVPSSLPGIHDWEDYMDVLKDSVYPAVAMVTFLDNCDFGRELLALKTTAGQEFRAHCRVFSDQLVTVVLNNPSVSSKVTKGLCRFSPEILLEGVEHAVFSLFADFTKLLATCGVLFSYESNVAVAQFSNYVVEKRMQHVGSDVNASEVPDIVQYLLRDFTFTARPEPCRELKLCCLIIDLPRITYPAVFFDLSGNSLSEAIYQCCLRLVKSYVMSARYEHQLFFTDLTLDDGIVRDAIVDAGVFYVTPGFKVWKHYCDPAVDSFVANYQRLYSAFLLQRRESSEAYYVQCDKTRRLARANVGASGPETRSNVSFVSKKD